MVFLFYIINIPLPIGSSANVREYLSSVIEHCSISRTQCIFDHKLQRVHVPPGV